MIKTVIDVEGMACGMCESHINDAIRRSFSIKKVTSSHKEGKTIVISEDELNEEKVSDAIKETGYQVTGLHKEPYVKKGLFGR